MSTSAQRVETESVAIEVSFTDDMICLVLDDGREVKTPLEFYPRLARATKEELQDYRLLGRGTGIHWPHLDEDLSVDSIVQGRRAFNKAKP
jgi:hypothetical protein